MLSVREEEAEPLGCAEAVLAADVLTLPVPDTEVRGESLGMGDWVEEVEASAVALAAFVRDIAPLVEGDPVEVMAPEVVRVGARERDALDDAVLDTVPLFNALGLAPIVMDTVVEEEALPTMLVDPTGVAERVAVMVPAGDPVRELEAEDETDPRDSVGAAVVLSAPLREGERVRVLFTVTLVLDEGVTVSVRGAVAVSSADGDTRALVGEEVPNREDVSETEAQGDTDAVRLSKDPVLLGVAERPPVVLILTEVVSDTSAVRVGVEAPEEVTVMAPEPLGETVPTRGVADSVTVATMDTLGLFDALGEGATLRETREVVDTEGEGEMEGDVAPLCEEEGETAGVGLTLGEPDVEGVTGAVREGEACAEGVVEEEENRDSVGDPVPDTVAFTTVPVGDMVGARVPVSLMESDMEGDRVDVSSAVPEGLLERAPVPEGSGHREGEAEAL